MRVHLPSGSAPTASALLFLALAVALPARSEAATPPNVLLILVDTLRHDHLGAYGYQRPTSPFIDSLARGGTVFLRAYSVSSFTPPAVASLFTGTRPQTVDSSSNPSTPASIPSTAACIMRVPTRAGRSSGRSN
jgi:arylsulfatase A-like enzyme